MPKPNGPTVDIHAHYFPEAYLRVIEQAGAPFGAHVDRSDSAGPCIVIGDTKTAVLEASYWDLDKRCKAMDRQGVDVHALSLTAPMVYFADAAVGTRLARATNDAMVEAHRAFPNRFIGCATLPMQDPAAALNELQRVERLPGIRAIYLGTNVRGRDLADPVYEPVFARCEAARLPVLLHPLTVMGLPRLSEYYLNNFLGNPFDSAVAAAKLVFGGVLDRHPKLEVCLPHAGGAMPYLYGRLTHGQRVRPETKGVAKKPFAAYLKRFTYDTISHSQRAMAYLLGLVGADRIMLGSDYCFDMGYQRPRDMVTRQLKLTRREQAKILGETAARLLKLS